jgi:DNA-binding transcriptional regulator YhcF (GntR family)
MSPALDLSIDRDSEVPLGTQLAWRLRALIAGGEVSAGGRLPGVREVAEAAGVNVNTVRAVYGRLEDQGLVVSEQGRGTFVAERSPGEAELARIADGAARSARAAGLDPRDVAAALFVSGAGDSDPPDDPPGAGADSDSPAASVTDSPGRDELKREIAALEAELAPLEGLSPGRPAPRAGAGRILDTNELAATRDELRERVAALRDDRDALRRLVERERTADRTEMEREPSPRRSWGHGGTWTGGLNPSYES